MKKDTVIILTTSFLCALVFTILKVQPFIPTDFLIILFGAFVMLAFFSSAFYKVDTSGNYDLLQAQKWQDPTGISLLQDLSYWGISGNKRILVCVLIQMLLATGAYFLI